jgi:peptidoglycan/xylan/chitin deacetylase (PgdA/CDA1 family)
MRQFAAVTERTSSVPHAPRAHDLEMVTRFQRGHGWTVTNASESNLDDASDYVLGSQSAWFTQPSGGLPAWIERTGLRLDLSARIVRLWLRVEGDLSGLGDITLYAGDAGFSDYFKWPIETSASPAGQYLQAGEGWVMLDLGFGDATAVGSPQRSAIEALRIRVDAPKGGDTTLHVNGVGTYSEPDAWPHGVVSLAFDDGWSDPYDHARPILDGYGYPATAYVIRDLIGSPRRLTLEQLHRLEDFSGWEVAGHSDRLAVHNARWTGVSPEALSEDIEQLQRWLRSEGFRGVNHCAYPGGAYDDSVLQTVRRYWRAARTIIQSSTEVVTPPNPLKLRAWSMIDARPPGDLIARIDRARAGKQWCILTFHHVVPSDTAATDYSVSDFRAIVDHIHAIGMPVRTIGDVLGI